MSSKKAYDFAPLTAEDIDEIMEVEVATWPEDIQATRELILARFAKGHRTLGARQSGRLIAMTSYSYTHFDPQDQAAFPRTFEEFSSQPSVTDPNAAFAYSIGVLEAHRKAGLGKRLLRATLDYHRDEGCKWVVGDGRCPSYSGSRAERFARNSQLHDAIDAHLRGETGLPAQELLHQDPVLRGHFHSVGFEYLWIIPGFLELDHASGDFRVIGCADLHAQLPPL